MPTLQKAFFLDRDGVINVDRGTYTWQLNDFELVPGVPEAIARLKALGYLVVVITNQAGVARGMYTHAEVARCHDYMQQLCNHQIDGIYYSPWHPTVSESLGRKPGSLLFQKAIARFGIDPAQSWMVGDRDRDLIPAHALGMRTILIDQQLQQFQPTHLAPSLPEAVKLL